MELPKTVQEVVEGLASLPGVGAVALGGSRTGLISGPESDYDLYVYRKGKVDPDLRRGLFEKIGGSADVDNSPFEEGDLFVPSEGPCIDIMYRDTSFPEEQIDRVWVKHQPSLGYSTCFLWNLRTHKALVDKSGELTRQVKRLGSPYPDALVESITDFNMAMIGPGKPSDWLDQIHSAEKRGDVPSRIHRTAAFMASVFDVVFAQNKVLHPGEKKLMGYVDLLCERLPRNFREDVESVYANVASGPLHESALKLALNLAQFCSKN